jgi:beta-mannosidase
VSLNGKAVGEHEGSFEPFTLDVTEHLRPGENNTLLVRVTAPWDTPNPRGNYPINHVLRGLVKGQYEHGEGVIPPNVNPLGIWRPVWLLLDEGISVDRVQVVTALDGRVTITAVVTNTTDQPWTGLLALNIQPENHDGSGAAGDLPLTLAPGTQTLSHTLQVDDPRLWWPWDHGDPNLYRLTADLKLGDAVIGSHETVFGIRTVRLDRAADRFTWYINDRPVFLRGSSYMPAL